MQPTCVVLTVATPGTLVPLTTDSALRCYAFLAVPHWSNTAAVYLGLAGSLNRSNAAGVVKRLADPTAEFSLGASDIANPILLSKYAIDADAANQKLLLTYWTA
jgi:hypothetical protein